jgi:glycosyltransferase involved in cell wall biosynthesis
LSNAVSEGWRVLVIDQSEGQETRRLCGRRIPWLPGKPGLAEGRNQALEASQTPFVVFTDDDIGFRPAFLVPMWRGFQGDLRVAAVLGRGRWPENERLMPGGTAGTHSWPVDPFRLGSGYNLGVRVSDCLAVGGFDTRLGPGRRFGGADDTEMLISLLLAGRRVVCTDDSEVLHPEWRDWQAEVRRQFGYGGGTALAARKHWRRDPRLLGFLARRTARQGTRIAAAAHQRRSAEVLAAGAYLAGLLVGVCSRFPSR